LNNPLRSCVTGVGAYLPDAIVSNDDISKIVDTTDEWIIERTGIRQRHRAHDDQNTSDLACHAAREALERAGRTAADVDLIVVATTTPDLTFPATAAIVQRKLGCPVGIAFDVGDLLRARVAFFGPGYEFVDIVDALPRVYVRKILTYNGLFGRVRFPAVTPPARTGHRRVVAHEHVSKFTRSAVLTPVNLAVNDYSGADAFGDHYLDQVSGGANFVRSEPQFRKRHGVGVVIDRDRQSCLLFYLGANIPV